MRWLAQGLWECFVPIAFMLLWPVLLILGFASLGAIDGDRVMDAFFRMADRVDEWIEFC